MQSDADLKEQRLLRQMRNEFDWFRKERESLMDKIWDECYRLYRAQAPNPRKSGDWRSRVHVPYAFVNVEDVVPHLMAGIFEADKPFKISSYQAPALGEAHERLALHQWNEQMNMEIIWEEVQKMKAIFGTAPYYVGFRAEFEDRKTWRVVQNPMNPEDTVPVVGVDSNVPVYVGNFCEPIHLLRVYVHPEATITEPKVVYWVQYRTRTWLEKQAGRFKNLDKIQPHMRHTGNSTESTWTQAEEFGTMHSSYPGGGDADTNPTYRVVTRYDDESRTVYSMLGPEGAEICIEDGEYPYWHNKCPISFDRYTIVPREFYGTGIIEPSISLMHEANMIRNQRRDNVSLAMNMIFEIKENAIDEEEVELVSRPGATIHSSTGDAIRPIPYPNVTESAFTEERIVANDIRNQSGMGGPLSGNTDPNSPSGTKFSLQQKAELLRLSRAIKREALCIKEIASQMVSNNAQFYPVSIIRDVLGSAMFPDYSQMSPQVISIRSLVQVEPVGVFANEDVLRQQFTNFMNIIMNQPAFAQHMDEKSVLKVGLKQFSSLIGAPENMLRKTVQLDLMEHRVAMTENFGMAQGRQIPQADPAQDHDIHEQHHRQLIEERPDQTIPIIQHIESHRMAKALMDQMLMMGISPSESGPSGGAQGPGSAPKGQGGGVVNPKRQPQPSSEEGVVRGAARAQGRTSR